MTDEQALAAFRRETQKPEFKGGWMDGRELTAADLEALSRLPSLEVMHGQLVAMVAQPLTGLVRTLNALLSGIAIALGQIQEQGLVGEAAETPAEEAPGDAVAEAETAEAESESQEPEAESPAEETSEPEGDNA